MGDFLCPYLGEPCSLTECYWKSNEIKISPARVNEAIADGLDASAGWEVGYGLPKNGRPTGSLLVCDLALERRPELFELIGKYELKG